MDIGISIGPKFEAVPDMPGELDFVELAIGEMEVHPREIDVEQLKSDLEEKDFDIVTHLPFRQPVTTEVEMLNSAVVEYLEDLIKFSAEIGAEKAVLHPHMRDDESEFEFDIMRDQLEKIIEAGEENGVEVCVENVGQFSSLDLFELGALLDEMNASMCFDTGHAYSEVGQEEMEIFLDEFSHLVSHVHAQDTRMSKDLHMPVGSAEIDFNSIGKYFSGFKGTVCLELFTGDPDYILLSKQRWEESVE
ncbi:MAG: sugar phosphate isomerase/epimerase family protein [Candidatus Aenigmatarchaeota archaeon]